MTAKRQTIISIPACKFGFGHSSTAAQPTWTSVGSPGVPCWDFDKDGGDGEDNDKFLTWIGPTPGWGSGEARTPEDMTGCVLFSLEMYFTTDGTNTDNFEMNYFVHSKARNESLIITPTFPVNGQNFAPTGSGAPGGLNGELGRVTQAFDVNVTVFPDEQLHVHFSRASSSFGSGNDENTDHLLFLGMILYGN